MAFQKPDVLLNVLEIAAYYFGKLVERIRVTSSDRAQQGKPLAGQKIAGRFDAGETHLLARPLRNPSATANCLERFGEVVRYIAKRSDGKTDRFHFVFPPSLSASFVKSATSRSTVVKKYGCSAPSMWRWCPFGWWLSYRRAGVSSPVRMNASR